MKAFIHLKAKLYYSYFFNFVLKLSKLKTTLCFLLVFIALRGMAQDPLQEGYDMLEVGNFTNAELFFSKHLNSNGKTVRICHARAVGLGGRKEEALDLFIDLADDYQQDVEVGLNLAEAYLWNSEAPPAISLYEEILKEDPNNFVANLGLGNALALKKQYGPALESIERAFSLDATNPSVLASYTSISTAMAYDLYKRGRYSQAKLFIDKVIAIDPNNTEAINISSLISEDAKTTIQANYLRSTDQGDNNVEDKQFFLSYQLLERHRLGVSASVRNTSESSGASASQQGITLSDKIKLGRKLMMNLGVGITASRTMDSVVERLRYSASMEYQPNDRLYSRIGYGNEIHNYTVGLIESNILMNHYSWAVNYMFTPKLGTYFNVVYTDQSDDNQRQLLYGSIYYSPMTKPLVRVGINYNILGFSAQKDNYFSPDKYQFGETFVLLSNEESPHMFKYKFQIGYGVQQVGHQEYQAISRVEALFGLDFKNGLALRVKYLKNNTAAATAVGEYNFQQGMLSLGYKF